MNYDKPAIERKKPSTFGAVVGEVAATGLVVVCLLVIGGIFGAKLSGPSEVHDRYPMPSNYSTLYYPHDGFVHDGFATINTGGTLRSTGTFSINGVTAGNFLTGTGSSGSPLSVTADFPPPPRSSLSPESGHQ